MEGKDSPRNGHTDKLLLALLEYPTITQAAHAIGISYSTAHRILSQPETQEALRALRNEATREGIQEALSLARAARATIAEALASDAPMYVRVRASEIALNYAQRMLELLDVTDRLDAIEARLIEKGNDQ